MQLLLSYFLATVPCKALGQACCMYSLECRELKKWSQSLLAIVRVHKQLRFSLHIIISAE